ncbi:hypothetical protein GCM10011369_08040 [Neiella marina]|uniref:Uncharacterized protein n=1 Tax=Neiella marina TaxID=508461 RepID=A0A8J2XLE6_9GAMM|nr:DsrH/TusB family sulfur metabolism protein [Neiella marina]GGA68817.1 hypothetical protein GCM10011369_08040 [Neiella marina]
MSSASDTPTGLLYVVRDESSSDWYPLVTQHDVIVLTENGVYRNRNQLPQCRQVYALANDCTARAVEPWAAVIDHDTWVSLSLECQQVVRI